MHYNFTAQNYLRLLNGTFTFTASVGFERAMYDVSEHETAEVCIILLNGTLLENINVRVTSKQGTASKLPKVDFLVCETVSESQADMSCFT